MPPTRLKDCEVTDNNEVIEDEDLVLFELLADVEPINHDELLQSEAWKKYND